ncbi:MAG: DUF1015 family protein [Lachnospiraceae bacterium]|nr:DUF1015 family protein [Lachnospiraceae bacterium]
MAIVKPFAAVRPKEGLESRIAALPYDVYSREEAKEKVKGDEYSFLRIDRAESQLDDGISTYDDLVYAKAREIYEGMLESGDFVKDREAVYYIYELTMMGRVQTGIVALASIDDYLNNVIKKHENTRSEKELDRIRHVDSLSAQTGPIFLAYRSNGVINDIVERVKKGKPVYDFTSEDNVRHRGFVIRDREDIESIGKTFEATESIYIADGHHRCASAVKVGLKRREAHPEYKGDEEFNYFLSVLFPDDQLKILDYNRVLKDLNGNTKEDILKYLKEKGSLEGPLEDRVHLEHKGQTGVFIEGKWYRFEFDDSIKNDDPVKGLDVYLLQEEILKPLFGIEDPKTDDRIDFVGGIRGLAELERRVGKDCKIAFCMYPTSIDELFKVADKGKLMPPKSTWFEPKLRSGLYIHEIER